MFIRELAKRPSREEGITGISKAPLLTRGCFSCEVDTIIIKGTSPTRRGYFSIEEDTIIIIMSW